MKYLVAIVLIGLAFCQKVTKKNDSIDYWVKNRSLYYKFVYFESLNNCDSMGYYSNRIEVDEFKRFTITGQINCVDDQKKMKKLVLEGLNLGIPFSKMKNDKNKSYLLNFDIDTTEIINKFWSDKDTLHLAEFDERLIRDQIFLNKKVIDTSPKTETVIDSNTHFLVNYVKNYGYPYIPDAIILNRKKTFIRPPDVLSIHTDEKTRFFLMESAIEMANKGKLSWQSPLMICSSFFTNISSLSSTKPIRFIYLDENGIVKQYESKLQILAIKEIYNREIPNIEPFLKYKKDYKILIQPSKHNNFSITKVKEQLLVIEDMLVNDYHFDTNLLAFSTKPYSEENQKLITELPFFFTLTILQE